MNKRILEALPLRQFFQQQLDHINNLISAHQDRKLETRNKDNEIAEAIESIVDGTDKRLRSVGNYRKQLRDCARGLLDHIDDVITTMPAALTISRSSFVDEPMVKALFTNCETIQKIFCYNPQVRSFFSDPQYQDKNYVYALLFLTHREKNILGAELNNDIVLRDIQQTHISFDGHQLIAICESEADARKAMRETLFNSVIKCLQHHIAQLRHSLSEEEKIQAANDPEQNIKNPNVYIRMLTQQLSLPRELIKVQDNLLRINSMGIKLPLDSNPSPDTLKLYEVEVGNQVRVATIVRFPRCELPPIDPLSIKS